MADHVEDQGCGWNYQSQSWRSRVKTGPGSQDLPPESRTRRPSNQTQADVTNSATEFDEELSETNCRSNPWRAC